MKTFAIFAITFLLACPVIAQTHNHGSHNHSNHQKKDNVKSSLSKQDRLLAKLQKICPVSGQELGKMGEPIKVAAGGQTVFLCCKGCQGKQINAKHWTTILTRLAKAQGTCPIMGKKVDSSNKSFVLNGHRVFVCCPPCIDKIKADPKKSLNKIHDSYVRFVATEQQVINDRIHVKAQKICPVSGSKLGTMGAPIKVKVGKDEHAFLCCKGCVGKQINATHWKSIKSNLAKAQGVCLVMDEPIDETMESVVVNGRRIFVCCPPCSKKIKANPNAYIQMLNARVEKSGKPAKKNHGHTHKH